MKHENQNSPLAGTVLPSNPPATTDQSDVQATLRSKHGAARLLVVDDNPAMRSRVEDLLLAIGIKADTAENGRQSVDRVAVARYDLILMDVLMPVMNGLEATRAIRLLPGGASVPILAMTANDFSEASPACLAAGMQDFIAKPICPVDFYATILHWLSCDSVLAEPVPLASVGMAGDASLPLLACIPSIHLDRGLATLRGDTAKYAMALHLFAEQCLRASEKLSVMLKQADFVSIEVVANALRGNAEMLGARKVSKAAGEVVAGCQQHRELALLGGLCTDLIGSLSLLAEEIRGNLPRPVSADHPDIDAKLIAETLTRLEAYLERGSINANLLARENAERLQTVFGEPGKVLVDRIEAFDYETAIARLRQLRSCLSGVGND